MDGHGQCCVGSDEPLRHSGISGRGLTVLPEEAARYPAEDRNIGTPPKLTANFHHTIPYFFTTIEVNLPVKSELLRIIRLKIESIGPRSST